MLGRTLEAFLVAFVLFLSLSVSDSDSQGEGEAAAVVELVPGQALNRQSLLLNVEARRCAPDLLTPRVCAPPPSPSLPCVHVQQVCLDRAAPGYVL